MPFLDSPTPADPQAQQWHKFLKTAFQKNVMAEELAHPLSELVRVNSLSSNEIATILMDFRAREGSFDVLRIFHFARLLLQTRCVSTADILVALLESSNFMKRNGKARVDSGGAGLPTTEERMFILITQLYLNAELTVRPKEAHRVIYAVIRWMHTVVESETAKQLESVGMHTPDYLTCGMYEALGSMALTIFSQPGVRILGRMKWWKPRRARVVSEMGSFDMNILQWMQSQLSGRLRALSKMPPFMETDDTGRPIFTEEQILESVSDLPAMRCRAGLYIWMNACLCGRPLTDDMSILGYLQARYPGDSQSLVVDLLIAAFDNLTNALLRKEPRHTVKEIRSFICNKIPLLLGMVAGYIAPLTSEACIQMAFMAITMDVLPPISAGSTDMRDVLKRTRLEFLQACTLHGLVSEGAIAIITQEPSPPLPRVTKQSKDNLITQCNNNVTRLETLVNELQSMSGNAGAVASCIVEVINNLCINKDTMSLKSVCNTLMKRVPDVDIILQYSQPANLLLPLCSLLNDWVHDQDQTEFTPSYEEFASILLFTLTVLHRYNLDKTDIGLANNDFFVAQLLQRISQSSPPSELSQEQSGQLARWVEGLFSTDDHGEIGGIGDEVMRQCPPQAFYLLVPTLFEQSVLACRSNALSVKTLKAGLELLLEPFLLPALIGGLSWLVKHSWEDHGDADVLLQVLDKLLKPSSSSQETQAMHRAVLGIVATPLSQSLEELIRKRPDKKYANALIELLKPYLGRQRTHHNFKSESAEWASTRDGGLAACVRNAIRDMITWTSSVGPNPPTKYTHAMFTTACQVLGSHEILTAMIAELKQQTVQGNGPAALDICSAMICAPTPLTSPSTLTLGVQAIQGQNSPCSVRDALRLTVGDTRKLLRLPLADAEAHLRLSRRVEAQSLIPQMPQIPMMQTQEQATDAIMADFGFTDTDVAGASATGTGSMQVDASMSSGNMDQSSTADFSNVALDLVNASAQDLSNLSSDANAMQMDQSHDFFDDLTMDMNSTSQSLSALEGGVTGDGQNTEEDIFADLMGTGEMGDFGDDYNFS